VSIPFTYFVHDHLVFFAAGSSFATRKLRTWQMPDGVKLGCEISAVDPKRKRILLKSGDEFGFNKLIVATGARTRTLSISGRKTVCGDGSIFVAAAEA